MAFTWWKSIVIIYLNNLNQILSWKKYGIALFYRQKLIYVLNMTTLKTVNVAFCNVDKACDCICHDVLLGSLWLWDWGTNFFLELIHSIRDCLLNSIISIIRYLAKISWKIFCNRNHVPSLKILLIYKCVYIFPDINVRKKTYGY